MNSRNLADLAAAAGARGVSLASLARELEAAASGLRPEQLEAIMSQRLGVMRAAVARGTETAVTSRSGLTGGDGRRLWEAALAGRSLTGTTAKAVARALGAAEVNAAMGRIVAAPTAGSSGVLPGVLLTVAEVVGATDGAVIESLWIAGLVGSVVQNKIGLSGAQGGCQAECGVAAGMAAAGAAHLAGGDADTCIHAAAIALKCLLGLVCDPVAGLVEVPCIKRNAGAAAVALAAVEMALAGVRSVVPPDEVISALRDIGRSLPPALRETGEGGLAVTPTGLRLAAGLKTGCPALGGADGRRREFGCPNITSSVNNVKRI